MRTISIENSFRASSSALIILAISLGAVATPAAAQDPITEWRETTSLPIIHFGWRAVAHRGQNILVFHYTGVSYVATIDQATGQLSPWRQNPTYTRVTPPIGVQDPWPTPAVVGDYVVIPDSPVSRVGTLAPDGTILQWRDTTGLNPEKALVQSVIADGNRIYSVAGFWLGLLNTVEMATLAADGTLSPWRTLTPLPNALNDPLVEISDGYLYVFGGEGNGGDLTPSRDVYRAQILADGSLGVWEFRGLLLDPRPHSSHLQANGTTYSIGGGVHASLTSTTEYAFTADLGNEALERYGLSYPFPTIQYPGSVSVGRYGYILGGSLDAYSVDRTDKVYYTIFKEKNPPVISGTPESCSLWPPNGKLRTVATISAADSESGLDYFKVEVTSNEAIDFGDVVITGAGLDPRTVKLAARRNGDGNGRLYTITSLARDRDGNQSINTSTCLVPHDQGK